MKNGTCVKCSSKEVYQMTVYGPRGQRKVDFVRSVRIAGYACVDCGYGESWVMRDSDRERVRKRCERVEAGMW